MAQERNLNDEDEISFISQIRSNPFLEREEAYVKMNQELEKKTSDLILRFEKYSKSRSHCSGSLYDGRDTMSEFGTDDGISSYGDDANYQEGFSTTSRIDHDGQTVELQNQNFETSISSNTLFEKLALLSSIPTDENEDKKKKPSRLQRATESVIKSLHSKLLNHEERLADLHLQYRHKIQENTILESKIKALEEERERLLRTITNLQGIVDKYAKQAESSKSNLSLKMQTVVSMKKEIHDYKRENQMTSATSQSLQTRLNRSLEENERLKNQNKSLNLHLRETQCDSKTKFEEQHQRIMELEKQKITLNTTIKKQAHLIKVFRDQKNKREPFLH